MEEDEKVMNKNFDFIHNEVGFPHASILKKPEVLKDKRPWEKRARLQFLQDTGRAQFDPTQPLFVPLADFMLDIDEEFCRKHARVDVNLYNEYLKTF